MDSTSIVQIVGSVVLVSDIVAKSIHRLKQLKTNFKDIPHEATTLTGQLVTVQVALDQLSRWADKDLGHDPRYQQLATQVDTSLECFGPLMISLKQSLDEIDGQSVAGISSKKMLAFMWNEQGMKNYLSLIDRQVNALNLFLQAIRCQSWEEQQRMIESDDNQSVLQQARECSSSIIVISDSVSIHSEYSSRSKISALSVRSAAVSIEFGFDALVAASKPYLAAHRAHLRRAIRRRAAFDPDERPASSSAPERTEISVKPDYQDASSKDQQDSPLPSSIEVPLPSGTQAPRRQIIERASQNQIHDETVRRPILTPATVKSESDNVQNKTVRLRILRNWHDQDAPSRRNTSLLQKTILSKRRSALPMADLTASGKYLPKTTIEDTNAAASAPVLGVLLLGIAESGKTTLSKAIQLHCNQLENIRTRRTYAVVVRENIIAGTRIVLDVMEKHGIQFDDDLNRRHAQTIPSEHPTRTTTWPYDGETTTAQGVQAISRLWKDRGFLQAYQHCSESSLSACAHEFAGDIPRIADHGYVPSQEDLLKLRVKTLGISPMNISLTTTDLRLWDTGGERSERKKWINCPPTSAIVFTVDVTACSRHQLREAEGHRMHEQLMVFEGLMNGDLFKQELVIIVFTKIDLLSELLQVERRLDEWDDDLKPLLEDTEPMNQEQLQQLFLSRLESRFRSLIRDEHRRASVRFVRADLVHPGANNSVAEILHLLEDSNNAPTSIWRQSV